MVFNKAAAYMLDTYDEVRMDYARGGLAQTACMMLASPFEENVKAGV